MMTVAGSKRNVELDPLRRALDRLQDTADPSKFGIMAMTLVFMRASREDDWTNWRSSHRPDAAALLWDVRHELGPEIDTTASALRDLPGIALMEMIDSIDSIASSLGNAATFRLVLEEFAAHGKSKGGVVFTPSSIAAVLTGLLDIASASTVYDPFCRAGELLVAAATQARRESQRVGIFVYGNMPDSEQVAAARMNTRLHQIKGKLERRGLEELAYDAPEIARFSRIITNPPFNIRNWTQYDSLHWHYGPPPRNNANFAWLQYAVERLDPGGKAAVILPNGALFSTNQRERHIREQMIVDGCVEALISLPPSLFHSTGVPATIWLLSRPSAVRNEILMIDASSAGHMTSRTLREFDDSEIHEITQIVTDWRSGQPLRATKETIRSVPVRVPEIRERDYNLSPAVYLTEPHAVPSHSTAMPKIRQLLDQLEAEHQSAREKDSIALRTLGDLTR
jgi:type I restriction enzyme M protein